MTGRPQVIAARPDLTRSLMDALSDVLRAVRLSGAVFFDVHASAPWVAETPHGPTIVGRIFPGVDHLISYHVVTKGSCWGGPVGEPSIELHAGDIIVFPQGDAHVMSSAPGMRGAPDDGSYATQEGRRPFTISVGQGTEGDARLVCGFLGCDARPFNPLLAALPRVLRVSERESGTLAAFVAAAVEESKRPRIGAESVLGRLSELMFVDVVRRYLESMPPDGSGWLSALREPFVARALDALHEEPARAWTLDMLARTVGLSRSALAERFTDAVGQPPMQYLASWRMQLAATHLKSSNETLAGIAGRIGYESEAAFSRAFKKAVGVSPGQWRAGRPG
jgi:AraC-like DNA-binding protein